MVGNSSQWNSNYEEQGYFVIRNYFNAQQMTLLRKVILTFHENWKSDNKEF